MTIGSPYYMTEVGAFVNSPGPYGTFDQAGNVWQWTESLESSRNVLRGGAFDESIQTRQNFLISRPQMELSDIGFRVAAAVPEPSAIVLVAVGFITIAAGCRFAVFAVIVEVKRKLFPGVGLFHARPLGLEIREIPRHLSAGSCAPSELRENSGGLLVGGLFAHRYMPGPLSGL